MLFDLQYTSTYTVSAGKELSVSNLRDFRARVGLALAASDAVVVDLTRTIRVDSWALLALSDLAAAFERRLTFAAPDYLILSIEHLKPHRYQAETPPPDLGSRVLGHIPAERLSVRR
jgi:hypothetical protein